MPTRTVGADPSLGHEHRLGCLRGLLGASVVGDPGLEVTSTGDHAFNGCSALASVAIPASVTQISEHAFLGCPALPAEEEGALRARYGDHIFEDDY